MKLMVDSRGSLCESLVDDMKVKRHIILAVTNNGASTRSVIIQYSWRNNEIKRYGKENAKIYEAET